MTTQVNHRPPSAEILQNMIIGLTVSFVALSLGAALGILSGRGAFAGMFSAGIIAFISSLLGGTRIQCSGPTAPMSSVSALVVAFAFDGQLDRLPDLDPNHFINITFLLTGAILAVAGILRLGRFISLIPNVVISGFMSGIAVLIWWGQLEALFAWNGLPPVEGSMPINVLVTLITLLIVFLLPPQLHKYSPRLASFIPSTLIAIVAVSVASNLLSLPIGHVNIHATLTSMDDFTALLSKQFPSDISFDYIRVAFPFALQLALLCYLDTLLTSLIVDKMGKEKSQQNRELVAQGAANAAVSIVGGIPGAQATIRSVLMLKEGATLRLAGIFVGIFVLIELLMFQHTITYIPQAVFTGILIKVGYDVFDFLPIRLYFHELLKDKINLGENIFQRHDDEPVFVTTMEVLFIVGTIAVTVLVDLNIAVVGFTLVFYALNRWVTPNNPIRDLLHEEEMESVIDEM